MEIKNIKINGKEKKIVTKINKSEIENNNDNLDNDILNDTIELTKIIETIKTKNE